MLAFSPRSLAFGLVATLVAVSSAATAQTTTSSAVSGIPTGISSNCSSFLTKLNADSSIKACTAPLLSATTYYTNATKSSSAKNAASGALQESLSRLCGANTGCDSGLIRQYLSEFWSSCTPEIKSQTDGVLDVYDVLYLLNPFREAICSKDDDGNFCLTTVASTADGSKTKRSADELQDDFNEDEAEFFSQLQERLHRRQSDASDTAGSTVSNSSLPNIAFLFVQPNSDKSALCSACTQNILASYIKFETSIPYAIGLSNSKALAGQSALYKAGKEKCGGKWAPKINSIAGTTDFAKVAAAPQGVRASAAVMALVAGVAALVMAA